MIFKHKFNLIFLNILQILNEINVISSQNQPPNVVIILADDLGLNDVSFRGSNQFITPNIDALAYHGTILNHYYVPALCTPSRATLLTGKYPIHTGMQHYVIPNNEPWGLPLRYKIMPEIFKEHGYSTNLVGKWHLGFYKKAFTPTQRGFDYHYGYLGGYIGYYDHSMQVTSIPIDKGYDFRKNMDIEYKGNGTYATDLFTQESINVIKNHNASKPLFLMVTHLAAHSGNEDDPFEAPPEEISKFKYIKDPNRRIYAAMVSKLDQSVGKIVSALEEKKILDNTIIIFYSDNGAPTIGVHSNSGSNHPLRGQKDSPWEGGVRTPGIIFSPLLKNQKRVLDQVVYVADWLPTLAAATNISIDASFRMDGRNLWEQLSSPNPVIKQRQIVHNIDDIFNYVSYMKGNWKYINGTTSRGNYDSWMGLINNETDPRSLNYVKTILNSEISMLLQSKNHTLDEESILNLREKSIVNCKDIRDSEKIHKYKCNPMFEECLFNIQQDPCEHFNLASENPGILHDMRIDIEHFRETAVKPARKKSKSLDCDPKLYNGTWTWWKDINSGRRINSNSVLVVIFCSIIGILSYF
ncbi:arylsulfatase B-like [Condylostylus longicornis]|uniref:arylsulfatase B-like n=1 Tax=Condylostylus longicornis TaxID=2530218 RepID=UPI00244E0298|nr:arylsulfatase B-like [Condylostylus longicornis]